MDKRRALTVAAFFFTVASAAVFKLSSYDLWWHLATGRLILGGHGIPHADPFSFTAQGVEWIDHEWLFQCFVFLVHLAAGPVALILAKAALICLAVAVVWRFVRAESGLPPATVAFLLIPFILAGRDRYLVRPELFTILFAALLLSTLLRGRRLTPARLWWIPVVVMVWANTHAGVIVGLVLIAAVLAGKVAEGLPGLGTGSPMDRPGILWLAATLVVSALAGLVNPFGALVYEAPFRLTSIIESGVFDNLEWRNPGWPTQWPFYLVLGIAVVVLVRGVQRRQWCAVLPLAFLALISVKYVRNMALFSILAPILITRIGPFRSPEADGETSDTAPLANISPSLVAVVLAVLGVFLLTASHRFPSGLGVDERRVPNGGTAFIAEHRPPGNLYNVYGFGGYVSWRLWPEVLTFIDGRNEVFLDLQRRLKVAAEDSREWSDLMNDYEIGYALVSYPKVLKDVTIIDPNGGPPRVVRWPYTETHFPRRHWALVFWDDSSMVYLRRSTAPAKLVAEHEYRHVFPTSPDFQVETVEMGWSDPAACAAELERKLREDPGCERAAALLERLLKEFG